MFLYVTIQNYMFLYTYIRFYNFALKDLYGNPLSL